MSAYGSQGALRVILYKSNICIDQLQRALFNWYLFNEYVSLKFDCLLSSDFEIVDYPFF